MKAKVFAGKWELEMWIPKLPALGSNLTISGGEIDETQGEWMVMSTGTVDDQAVIVLERPPLTD